MIIPTKIEPLFIGSVCAAQKANFLLIVDFEVICCRRHEIIILWNWSQDEGYGTSDGISVNMIFCCQEGVPIFHNAEVAPPNENGPAGSGGSGAGASLKESQLSVLTMSTGEFLTHCNK